MIARSGTGFMHVPVSSIDDPVLILGLTCWW